MRIVQRFFLVIAIVGIPSELLAQDHEHQSPYVGLETRDIKALSGEEIEGLLNGQGMSLALPAELNGLPGPRHVLDMKIELRLTENQVEQVQQVFDAMSGAARQSGAKIVEFERQLDRGFAERSITEDSLDDILGHLAIEQAHLRAAHLKAHLSLVPILTDDQRAHYNRLRGYEG